MGPRLHHVRLTATALADLHEIGEFIGGSSLEAADRVLTELQEAVDSLRSFPARGAPAPEGRVLGVEARQILRCGYRVVFTIEAGEVWVHFFMHHARRPRS